MRTLDQEEQAQRKRKVLQTLIHEYIRTGKPVGSKAIAGLGRLGLSSATIRSILAELEREEMIVHQHTSSGRSPTDKGYRLYVDSLVELQRLAVQEQVRIESEYQTRINEIEDLLNQTSHMLSSLSHYTGFVMAPKLDRNIFSNIQLFTIGEHRILAAMVTTSGLAKHFIVNTVMEIPRERLRRIASLINQNLQGQTLEDVQSHILERLEDAQAEYREIMTLAREIGQEIKKLSASEIYLDGASNILSLPDFSKTSELTDLFKIIEEKQILTNLLEHELMQDEKDAHIFKPGSAGKNRVRKKAEKTKKEAEQSEQKVQETSRVQVRIGSENPVKAMQNLSLVSSTYKLSDRTVGVLGILGPKRMEYPKMIALVDYVSQVVNRFLKELEKNKF